MSRNQKYQRLLNSRRWRDLRAWKLEHNPLCELCAAEGYVVAAVDIHHITPVESAHTDKEMEALCFAPGNLQALCIPCHKAIHQQLRSQTKEAHQQRAADDLQRWADKMRRPNKS